MSSSPPQAEHLPFSKLIRGRTNVKRSALQSVGDLTLPLALFSPAVYLTILRTYHYIFVAFEDEFEKRRRVYPRLNPVHFRELARCKAFERDLDIFTKLAPQSGHDYVLPAGKLFVDEMRSALARQPVLVIAYSYALYIGLLATPRRTRAMLCDGFGFDLESEEGIAIWSFSETIKNRAGFRKRYDTVLDEFELSGEEREIICRQVHRAFEGLALIFREVKSSYSYIATVTSTIVRFCCGMTIVALLAITWFHPFRWAVFSMLSGPK